jgi:hypothetical protein
MDGMDELDEAGEEEEVKHVEVFDPTKDPRKFPAD